MPTIRDVVSDWIHEAESKATAGKLSIRDLAQLRDLTGRAAPKQRLLYLHTRTPSVTSQVIGMAQHEPVTGGTDTLRTREEWPYGCVHDAIIDGWQVVQFPDLMAPYDDRELSYVGYEFILQRIEEVVDE